MACIVALTAALPIQAATLVRKNGPATVTLIARAVEKDKLTIRLSDEITIIMSVKSKLPIKVETPSAIAGDSWEVWTKSPAALVKREDGFYRWRYVIVAEPRQPNKHELPLPLFKYREQGKDWQEIKWQPITVEVSTRIKSTDIGQAKDIFGIEELPPAPASWFWPALLGSGAIVLLAASALVLRRLLRRRVKPAAAVAPAELALRELDQIAEKLPEDAADVEPFHTRLAQVIRVYLERQFQIPAQRRTSLEFVDLLSATNHLTKEQLDLLHDFFQRCDLGKFAPLNPGAEECKLVIEQARSFVKLLYCS